MKFNVAARAGRWSAGHWKTALSGWIAFCVVAVALGSVAGTKMLKDTDTAAGETKTAETMLRDAGFPNHAGESVLVESKTATLSDPAVPCSGRGRRPDGLGAAERPERPLAARTGERRPDLERPALGPRPVRDRRRPGQGRREGPADPGCGRDRAGPARRVHRRRVRLRQREPRAQRHPEQGLPAGRVLVAAGHADHPAGRVRRSRGGRPAGAARLLGCARDDRSVCAGQPCGRGRRCDQVGDPADRDGGRRRLLALLPPP